jgi:hypothetical protein
VQGKNGFCIVDVFESAAAVERFSQAMGSIPQGVGIEEPQTSSQRTRSSRRELANELGHAGLNQAA